MAFEWTKIIGQFSSIKIKSITDGLFKYGLLIFGLGVVAAILNDKNWVVIFLFIVASIFIVIGLFFYCYFSIKNPDYLRSESFQISKQSIEMLGDKDNSTNPNVTEIIHISSPYAKELGDGKRKIEID